MDERKDLYLNEVYKHSDGQVKISRVKILEHSGNMMILVTSHNGEQARLEKIEDAK